MRCNYLSLSEIPASGTKVLIYHYTDHCKVISYPCSRYLYQAKRPYKTHFFPSDLEELRQELRQRERMEWGPRRRAEMLRRLDTVVASHAAQRKQESEQVLKDETFLIKGFGCKAERVPFTGKFVPHPPNVPAATGPQAESGPCPGKFVPQPPKSKPPMARRAPRCLRDALLRRNITRAMSEDGTTAEGGDKVPTADEQQYAEDGTGLPAVEKIPSGEFPNREDVPANQEEVPPTKRLLLRRPQADNPSRLSPIAEMPHRDVEQRLTQITGGARPKDLTACTVSPKRRRTSADVLSVTTPADTNGRLSITGASKSAQPRCTFQDNQNTVAQTDKLPPIAASPNKITKDKQPVKRNLRHDRKEQPFLPDINKK